MCAGVYVGNILLISRMYDTYTQLYKNDEVPNFLTLYNLILLSIFLWIKEFKGALMVCNLIYCSTQMYLRNTYHEYSACVILKATCPRNLYSYTEVYRFV